MTRAINETFDSPLGGLWQVLAGSAAATGGKLQFSTAPSNNPIAVTNMGLRSNGCADVDVSTTPDNIYGTALYARLVDAQNWVRAVLRATQSSSTYYVTEYQHTTYTTEYLWVNSGWSDNYEVARHEVEIRYPTTCTGQGWSSYSNYGSPSGCRANPPATPADEYGPCGSSGPATAQYRVVVAGTGSAVGCAAGVSTYQTQRRTQTVVQNYATRWEVGPYSIQSGSGETYTGNTRVVRTGSFYRVASSSTSSSNPGQTTSPSSAYDFYVSTGADNLGTYWATSPAKGNDYLSGGSPGQSRTVASGTYWDQNYEAGAPTRQAGPYTSTSTTHRVELEQCVNGAVTALGSYAHSGTVSKLRVLAQGDALKVFLNNGASPVLTGASAAHKTTGTKTGVGGGASSYNATNPAFADFAATGLSTEYSRTAEGGWAPVNRKIRVGNTWVGTDAVKK